MIQYWFELLLLDYDKSVLIYYGTRVREDEQTIFKSLPDSK